MGPILAGFLRTTYGTWQVPMLAFGGFGFVIAVVILMFVRPWLTETQHAAGASAAQGGATSLRNRNTIVLTTLSIFYGLSVYGFLGLYPTFLRENQHYSPADAGTVISFFGFGSLVSIFGGWLGDRYRKNVTLALGSLGTGTAMILLALATSAPPVPPGWPHTCAPPAGWLRPPGDRSPGSAPSAWQRCPAPSPRARAPRPR